MLRGLFLGIAWSTTALAAAAQGAGVVTDSVTATPNVTNASDAVGLPVTSNFGTDITPFTPTFTSYVILGDTSDSAVNSTDAQLTLHFAQPVVLGNGPDIGVFTNVGLQAGFDPQTEVITATPGPALFSTIPQMAVVSVSADGNTFIPLNGGDPIDLAMVADAFSDSTPVYDTQYFYVDANGGTAPMNPFKPFTGSLADFSGETYAQMVATLNGSFGGKWIDVSTSGLPQINYVRFDVPQGANYRVVLDAVTAVSAVPEPATAAWCAFGIGMLMMRRRRSR